MHEYLKNLQLVSAILAKYQYGFYAFRSNIAKNRLFDVDICYFDEIPLNIYQTIKNDLQNSGIQYEINLYDWHVCNQKFRDTIEHNLVCIKSNTILNEIEANHYGHFIALPKVLKLSVIETEEFTLTNSGFKASTFNLACKTNGSSDDIIYKIMRNFRLQEFSWWIGPSSFPKNINDIVIRTRQNIINVRGYIMLLKDYQQSLVLISKLKIAQVTSYKTMQDFLSVLRTYDNSVMFFNWRNFLESQTQERLFVGYDNSIPVCIGSLFTSDHNLAGIYNLLTIPTKRQKGFGTAMIQYLVTYCHERKYQNISLASMKPLVNFYNKFGFKVVGQMTSYEVS